MRQPMMVRYEAEKKASRKRSRWRVAGVIMLIGGAAAILASLFSASAPQLFEYPAGATAFFYLVIGLVLIVCGGLVLHQNRED